MILDTKESNDRLSSPDNLVNRLKRLSEKKTDGMKLFTGELSSKSESNLFTPPSEATVKDVLNELESELRDGLIKNTAKQVLGDSLVQLSNNLKNIENPVNYARIATDMGKLLVNMETANKSNEITNNQQVIIYRPVINNESSYQTVHVSE